MQIPWENTKHSLGIISIDNQHKELFSIVNSLYKAKERINNHRIILSLIKRLYAYTNYHFLTEENIFIQFNYPETEEHKKNHAIFTGNIKKQFEIIKRGEKYNIDEILEVLLNWIRNHIEVEDRKYAEYFTEKGIKFYDSYTVPLNSDSELNTFEYEAISLWEKRKLELNIHLIDNQHKELVYILQQVNDLNKTGISDSRIKIQLSIIIKKLFYYSQFHFNLEESLMAKENYPGLVNHREQHKYFIKKISDFARAYHNKKAYLTNDILLFLKDWTINHILQDDAAFKLYLDSLL